VEGAAREADALEAAGLGDVRVDTDGRYVEAVVADALERSGWPWPDAGAPAVRPRPPRGR